MQESENRHAPYADLLECSPYSEVPARRNQSFFECGNGFGRTPGLVIHFRKIQVQLSVIVFHAQSFATKRFGVTKPLFSQRSEQARVGQVKRIFGGDAEGAPRVLKSVFRLSVAEVLEALLEVVHSSV